MLEIMVIGTVVGLVLFVTSLFVTSTLSDEIKKVV